jgi:hypothetical protein
MPAALGNNSKGNTGINYPYMRYADVLLMYAEAVNELENGVTGANGAKAIEAFKEVRNRAFAPENRGEKVDDYIAANTSKEAFFKLIMDERKWEFGGENIRWKDLVRWNKYAETVRDVFYDYYGLGVYRGGGDDYNTDGRFDKNYPPYTFTRVVANPNDINVYPNTTLDVLEFYNLWEAAVTPTGWTSAETYNWMEESTAAPRAQTRLSLRGYISVDELGKFTPFDMWQMPAEQLPVLRYILPFPASVISRGAGAYQNYYGY